MGTCPHPSSPKVRDNLRLEPPPQKEFAMPRVLIRICSSLLLLGLMLFTTDRATTIARAIQSGPPAIQIVSPASGGTITSDDVALQFAVQNFDVDCAQSGRPEEAGVGHIHVMLDGLLVNLGCGETFTFSGYGLAPGMHRLVALLAANRHHNLVASNEITFDYRPQHPQPLPRDLALGTPGAQLVSPQDGATVPAQFSVVVNAVNFVPTGDLSAKPNVAGYGQWLVRIDGNDVSYGLGTTFDGDLTAWGPGSHTIMVLPVQNDHHGFKSAAPLEFQVVVAGAATPAP